MCPHADNFNCFDVIKHLVYKAMLDIDPTGAGLREVTDKFFVGWRRLIRILRQDFKQALGLGLQAGSDEFLRIALGLAGVGKSPAHQSSS